MAETVTVSIRGFGELEQALRSLGPKVARKVGAKAMKAAAKPIVEAAQSLVPVLTGELQDHIAVVSVRTDVEKELKVQVGVTKPTGSRAHLTEFGTVHSAAQPFMRPAFDAQADNALAIMGAEIWKGIAAEAAKTKKVT